MRGMFGLVSLLIGALIVAYLWAQHTSVVVKSAGPVRDQAQQLSGHSVDGTSAADSIKTEPVNDPGGRLKALRVVDVTPGGGMETFYGLQKGDRITMLGALPVDMNNDYGLSTAMLLDSYEKMQPLVVIRNGQEVTLPITAPSSVAPPAAGTPTTATPVPANPSPATPKQGQSLQDQVKRLMNTAQ